MATIGSVAAGLAAAAAQVNRRAGDAVIKTAADIQRDARIGAPVDTGMLQGSITRTTTRRPGSVEAEIGPEVNYGAHVEYGTVNQTPQPYMGPAVDRHEPAFLEAMAELGELL